MRGKTWLVLILAAGIVISPVLLLGCIEKPEEPGTTSEELHGTIKISGAWALYPMVVTWSEEFQKVHPGVRIDLSAGGAGKGMTDVLGGMVDIGMVSRALYPQELERGAFWVAVTKDAVVPTMNVNNPVSEDLLRNGVTKQTFEGIWITGTITTWGEVVGTGNTDKIAVYTRSDSCGAAEEWARYLGNNYQEDLLGVAVYGDPGLAEAVRKDQFGIGYNNLNYAYDAMTGEPVAGIRIIPIDLDENGLIEKEENFYGTKSELQQAIGRGDYPSPPARDLNLVTKGKPSGLTREFIAWCLTEGQQYVSETGYIPLPEEKLRAELEKIG
ncbi:MAG: phosphate ABC transporter substrate-binding protein [Methanophagales archaeon ANME-1-THS]|nr:MAG: phosphate ABC transporter substrate-binding protein [Methanophagales archaeon ANME-1-THS]